MYLPGIAIVFLLGTAVCIIDEDQKDHPSKISRVLLIPIVIPILDENSTEVNDFVAINPNEEQHTFLQRIVVGYKPKRDEQYELIDKNPSDGENGHHLDKRSPGKGRRRGGGGRRRGGGAGGVKTDAVSLANAGHSNQIATIAGSSGSTVLFSDRSGGGQGMGYGQGYG